MLSKLPSLLGTVRRLDGARPSALLFIRPLAQRSRKEGKRAFRRQIGGRRPKPLGNVFSCSHEEDDLRPLNGGALGLNAESPIGREPSGRPRRSTRGTSRFQRSLASAMRLARRQRAAAAIASSCNFTAIKSREGTSNGIFAATSQSSVLDDVGLRRTLGGRLKTDPQLTA